MTEKVALYCRVSTKEQADKKTIDDQVDACQGYCAREGYEITEVFKDDGISGTVPFDERPAGGRLLDTNGYSKVIVTVVDRLGRDVVEGLLARRAIEDHGTPLEFVTQSFDGTPEGDMMFGQFLLFAEYERKVIARRMLRGRIRAAKDKQFCGGRSAYGFDVKDNYLVVNEAQAEVVRRIFRLCAEGKTQAKIAEILRADKVPSPNGRWHQSHVGRILTNEMAIGRAHYGKTQVVNRTEEEINDLREKALREGRDLGTVTKTKQVAVPEAEWLEIRCPEIVDLALWRAAHRQLAKRLRDSQRPRDHTTEFLLSGLLKCVPCGGGMSGHSKGNHDGHVWRYYFCNRMHKGRVAQPCREKEYVRAEPIEEAVFNGVVKAFSEPERVMALCEVRAQELASEKEGDDSLAAAQRRNLADARKERTGYEVMLAKGRITEEAFDAHIAGIDAHIASLEEELERLTAKDEARLGIKELRRQAHSIAKVLQGPVVASLDEKKKLIRTFVERVWLRADNSIAVECIVPGLLSDSEQGNPLA